MGRPEYQREQGQGASPLVSAVLLIAITMTTAGVLAFVASNFIKPSAADAASGADCDDADFSIYSCTFDSQARRASIILQNLNVVELTSLRAFVIYSNGTVSEAVQLNATLGPSLKSFSVTGIDDGFARIVVRTQCPELSRESPCARA